MKLSAAAKVGLLTVVSLVLLVVSLSWLTQTSFRPRGYQLRAIFTDVDGLMPGASVLLMGVRVGRVLTVTPEDRTVVVDLEISDRHTHVLTGSHFKIINKGLIGDKNLEIFPPERTDVAATFVTADSTVYGDTPPRLDIAIEQANKALHSLRDLADSPETKLALKDGIKNFQTAFKELNALIRHTDAVAVGANSFVTDADNLSRSLSPEDLSGIVTDIRTLTSGLRHSYQAFAGEGDQLADAKATLANIRSITTKLEGIATQVETLSSDPKLKSDMKDLVANSRQVTTQVRQLVANPPKLSPRFDLMGVQAPDKTYGIGSFNMGLRLKDDRFLAGVEEIGEKNLLNVTWGKPDYFGDGLGFHVGMVRSKIGAGVDWLPKDNVELVGEVFDPVNPALRLSASYYPSWWAQKYGLTGAWIRDMRGNNDLFIGAQWRPLD